MNFCEVDIFYLYTRCNDDDLDAEFYVDSDLGAFSRLPKGFGLTPPANSVLITSIHLDRVDSPINRVAVAILDYLPNDVDGGTALEPAEELLAKIDRFRSQRVPEPVQPRGVTILNFLQPFSDVTIG